MKIITHNKQDPQTRAMYCISEYNVTSEYLVVKSRGFATETMRAVYCLVNCLLSNHTTSLCLFSKMGSHCDFNGRKHVVRLDTEVMAVLLFGLPLTGEQPMVATITKLAPHEFRFEYDNADQLPTLKKGKVFTHEGKEYRIIHYRQVFGEQVYCSFLVIAKLV